MTAGTIKYFNNLVLCYMFLLWPGHLWAIHQNM